MRKLSQCQEKHHVDEIRRQNSLATYNLTKNGPLGYLMDLQGGSEIVHSKISVLVNQEISLDTLTMALGDMHLGTIGKIRNQQPPNPNHPLHHLLNPWFRRCTGLWPQSSKSRRQRHLCLRSSRRQDRLRLHTRTIPTCKSIILSTGLWPNQHRILNIFLEIIKVVRNRDNEWLFTKSISHRPLQHLRRRQLPWLLANRQKKVRQVANTWMLFMITLGTFTKEWMILPKGSNNLKEETRFKWANKRKTKILLHLIILNIFLLSNHEKILLLRLKSIIINDAIKYSSI